MIVIMDKSMCCGCTACQAACPCAAIEMKRDALGFPYPFVDEGKCVDCGLCEKVCPYSKEYETLETVEVYAAANTDDAVRAVSSSGGVFPLLAKKVTDMGGVVYGASFNEDASAVVHCAAETQEETARFRGSKYVQSDMGGCYKEIKAALCKGREVLFTGTPCQVAGLRSYLGRSSGDMAKSDEGLYTMACACHGVPSPEVWKRYHSEITARYSQDMESASDGVTFRDKSTGWKNYRIRIGEYSSPAFKDPYMKAMLKGYTIRPSCRNCIFKGKNVGYDLMAGDWWRIADLAPEMDDDKGTSALVVNTPKGRQMLPEMGLRLKRMPSLNDPGNGGYSRKNFEEFDSDRFVSDLNSTDSVYALLKSMTEATLKEKIVRRIKNWFKI